MISNILENGTFEDSNINQLITTFSSKTSINFIKDAQLEQQSLSLTGNKLQNCIYVGIISSPLGSTVQLIYPLHSCKLIHHNWLGVEEIRLGYHHILNMQSPFVSNLVVLHQQVSPIFTTFLPIYEACVFILVLRLIQSVYPRRLPLAYLIHLLIKLEHGVSIMIDQQLFLEKSNDPATALHGSCEDKEPLWFSIYREFYFLKIAPAFTAGLI